MKNSLQLGNYARVERAKGFAAIYKVIPDVSFASTYGAAGSLVVFMIWAYYSSQIFFLVPNSQKSLQRAMARSRRCILKG